MSDIKCENFGKLKDGRMAHLYTLRNTKGTEVKITDFGGHVQSIRVRDRDFKPVDVVLGYGDIETYEAEDKYIGALVGRCANRIGKGDLIVDGQHYQLECNNGENHLHGGIKSGYNKKLWQGEITATGLLLTYVSPDGEGNYPGRLTVKVRYGLSNDNEFSISYEAVSDADTVCNLTNHSYFNLAGYDSGSILDQKIQIFADEFTPADQGSIPDGRLLSVAGTPMDLRELQPIGAHIEDDYDQLKWAGGYDHNWVIRDVPAKVETMAGSFGYDLGCPIDYLQGGLKKMAYAESDKTGITLTAYTTQPGMQFYAGNYLDGTEKGKHGVRFTRRTGFALEAQFYPDAVHHADFPQPLLKKGDTWKAQTVYVFGVKR